MGLIKNSHKILNLNRSQPQYYFNPEINKHSILDKSVPLRVFTIAPAPQEVATGHPLQFSHYFSRFKDFGCNFLRWLYWDFPDLQM